jgi:hypothetical protein
MLILFIAVTTILFMFPFAPTAGLFLRRRQALGPSPLSEGAYAPDHFARNLIAKLRARAALIAQPLITVFEYRLDGEPLLILPASMRRVPSECATKMSYALADAVLPTALPCDKEIAAEGSLLTGGNASYRALYAADTLHIGGNSTVIRWCHADTHLKVDKGCRILGRASANKTIKVDAPCLFMTLTAPTILIGSAEPRMGGAKTGDLASATGTDHVAREPVSLAAGTRRHGSIKAYGQLCVGADSVIEGALVCEGDIVIGSGCLIWGPIVAEGDVRIAEGCEVGRPDDPGSVVGEDIEIVAPAVIHGAVHARHNGIVTEM